MGAMTRVRVRPAIRRLALWVGPALLLIGAWQVWDAVEDRRLRRALLPIVAGGPEAGLTQPTGDAGRYYAAAAVAAVWQRGTRQVQLAPGQPVVDVAWSLRDALSRSETPTAAAVDAASRQIEQDAVVLDLLTHASDYPFDGFSPGTGFNYLWSGLLNADRSAGLLTLRLVMAGEVDRAARAVFDRVQLLRTARESGPGLLFVETTVRSVHQIATDAGILLRVLPSDARLDELDRALAGIYADDALEQAMRRDIQQRYQALRSLWTGRPVRTSAPILARPWIQHQTVTFLQTAAVALETARRPWPANLRGLDEIPEIHPIGPESIRFWAGWRRDATRFAVSLGEAVAAARCARLAIRVEQFRRVNGKLPESLDDLGVEEREALDPFTGEGLLYSRREDGYVVYSVGSNGKDESGTLTSDPEPGRPLESAPRPDVGVRVILTPNPEPNVDRRP